MSDKVRNVLQYYTRTAPIFLDTIRGVSVGYKLPQIKGPHIFRRKFNYFPRTRCTFPILRCSYCSYPYAPRHSAPCGNPHQVREAFDSRGWSILPHECEIGLASACAPGSSGVVGAAGAAACEFALASRRLSKSKPPSRSCKSPAAAQNSGPPCGGDQDSSAAATAGATDGAAAGAAAVAGEIGRTALEGYGKAKGNDSPASAEQRADEGMSGSDPREQKPAGPSDLANGVIPRGMVDDAAVSQEVFVRAKPESCYGGVGGGGTRRQGEGGWKSFLAGVGFGAAAAALTVAVATSIKAGRVRFR